MSPTRPVIRSAVAADLAGVSALLRANALPLEGLPPSLDAFIVAELGGDVVGVVGLECYGEVALLRSAAVDAAQRGSGLGTRLVQRIIALAEHRGIPDLWLLTTTADAWFVRFGFVAAARADVPEPVRASREFHGACPDTAVVMRRAS